MATVNLTVRVDERTKKDFDGFCDNVGINATAAVNMFIKNVVRTRKLPFVITDISGNDQDGSVNMSNMKKAMQSMRAQSVENGNSEMTLDEINAEIAAYRKNKRKNNA